MLSPIVLLAASILVGVAVIAIGTVVIILVEQRMKRTLYWMGLMCFPTLLGFEILCQLHDAHRQNLHWVKVRGGPAELWQLQLAGVFCLALMAYLIYHGIVSLCKKA
jgi:hypothetical protein